MTAMQSMSERPALNYFVFKVGRGNMWLQHWRKLGGLYVGFDDIDSDKWSIRVRGPDSEFTVAPGRGSRGDDNIAWLAHAENAKNALILVFGTEMLHVFRVRHDLGGRQDRCVVVHTAGSAEFETARSLYARHRKTAGKRHVDYDGIFGPDAKEPVFKVLPVEDVACVRRSSLYTSVDSLSVYQGLNRGTCQRLWRANGPLSGSFPAEVSKPLPNGALQERVVGFGTTNYAQETPFASFVRLYLNEVLGKDCQPWLKRRLASEDTLNARIPEAKRLDVVAASMNPSLVETAAYYFCLDLGLIDGQTHLLPDVGVGKGLDVIDVRARVRNATTEAKQEIVRRLCSVLHADVNAKALQATSLALLGPGVLELQCKAAKKGFEAGEGVVYFGEGGDGKRPTVVVSKLVKVAVANPADWPLLAAFFEMQVENIFH